MNEKKVNIKTTIPLSSKTIVSPKNYIKVLNHSTIDLDSNGSLIKNFYNTTIREENNNTRKINNI